jgi:hypothetical protein
MFILQAVTVAMIVNYNGSKFIVLVHVQPSLVFVGEARSLPQSGAPKGFTRVGSGLTGKH